MIQHFETINLKTDGQGLYEVTSKIAKWKKHQKYPVRVHNRCHKCGRPRAYIRHVGLCRICFREMAHNGELPGVRKASL